MRSGNLAAGVVVGSALIGLAICSGATVVRIRSSCQPQLRALVTFNIAQQFVSSPEAPRRFSFTGGQGRAMLMFAVPGLDPSAYRLSFSVRAASEILAKCDALSPSGAVNARRKQAGDVASFVIDMRNGVDFVCRDCCCVGLVFDTSVLRPGDTVELLSFEFEWVRPGL